MHGSTILTVAPPAPPLPAEEHPDAAVHRAAAEFQARMTVTPDLPAIMTTQEVASFLRVSDYTVRTYVRKGVLPAVKLDGPGGLLRFKRQEVLDYLEGRPAAIACGCGGELPDADTPYSAAHDGISDRRNQA